jgi:hypothetical protein
LQRDPQFIVMDPTSSVPLTVAPSTNPSTTPTVAAPCYAPSQNPTVAPTVAVTLAPTTDSSIVGGCNAADIQQILNNQALILDSLHQLAGVSGAAEGDAPVGGSNNDGRSDVTTSASSKNSANSSKNGPVVVLYAFAAIGAIATLVGAVIFVAQIAGIFVLS